MIEGWGWAVIPTTGIAIGAGVWGDRKLEGRRIAIDEYFPDEYVKATKGFLHFAFMDSYNYNKRMGLDQEYFEFNVEGKIWRVWTKGTFVSVEMDCTPTFYFLTWYDWLEIAKNTTLQYWLSRTTKFYYSNVYRIVLKDAGYNETEDYWWIKADFWKGWIDYESMTIHLDPNPVAENIFLKSQFGGYLREEVMQKIKNGEIDLTWDRKIEEIEPSKIITTGNNTEPAEAFLYEIEAGKVAFYFIPLFVRKWSLDTGELWASKIKSGIALWHSGIGRWIQYPETASERIRVSFYERLIRVLGTNIPEVLDRILVDIKEVAIEMDPMPSYPEVYVY